MTKFIEGEIKSESESQLEVESNIQLELKSDTA